MVLHTEFSPVWSCLLHNSLLWFHGGFWLRSGLFLLGGRGGTAALGPVVGGAGVAALPLPAHRRRPPSRGRRAGLASVERGGHLQLWDIQQLKALCCQGHSALLAAFKAHTALHFLPLTDRQIKTWNKKPNPSKLTKPGTDKTLKTTPQSKLLWFTCNSCSAVGQASLLQQLRGVFPQLN